MSLSHQKSLYDEEERLFLIIARALAENGQEDSVAEIMYKLAESRAADQMPNSTPPKPGSPPKPVTPPKPGSPSKPKASVYGGGGSSHTQFATPKKLNMDLPATSIVQARNASQPK